MKTLLLAGAAAILVVSGASAQIQSPSQPGMAPPTGVSAQGGASGSMAGDARNTRSMTAHSGQARRVSERRTNQRRAVRPEDQAYMGGGMILENGRPVDMGTMSGTAMGGSAGMMTDRGVGSARGRVQDPTGMGTAVMPGGTGTGRGAGASSGGGN